MWKRHSAMSQLVRLLILATFAHVCRCYPRYFITPPYGDSKFARLRLPATVPTCQEHPSQALGPHAAPSIDADSTITLTEQAPSNAAVGASLCRGSSYDVQVVFGQGSARWALLTSSAGQLQPSNEFFQDNECTGQRFLPYGADMPTSFQTVLFIPCNATARNVTLKMTSVASSSGSLLQATKTFSIQACGAGACENKLPVYPAAAPPPQQQQQPAATQPAASTPQSGKCAAVQYADSNCTASPMGYTCSLPISQGGQSITVHYSLGGCAPDNECTRGATFPSQLSESTPILHMAAEAEARGYVSVAFASQASQMYDSDAVIGWPGSINMYPIGQEYSVGAPYPPSTLAYSGVLRTSAGKTIICFGRPMSMAANSARYSSSLDPTNLKLNWAIGNQEELVYHRAAGGLPVNIAAGSRGASSSGGGGSKAALILAHGALMAAAWALLFPLGVLCARHKRFLGEMKVAGVHVWFQLHRLLQVTGFASTLAALVIAIVKLEAGPTTLGQVHMYLGYAVFSLTGAQILAALPRPKPDHAYRAYWDAAHHWVGRITLAGGIATTYIGIVLLHTKFPDQYAYAPWIVPTATALGVLLLVDMVFSMARTPKPAAAPLGDSSKLYAMVDGNGGVAHGAGSVHVDGNGMDRYGREV